MEPAGPLFHYTNSAGFLGIVRSGQLWASDAEFLNDAQELQYGREQLYRALLEQAASTEHLHQPGSAEASRATVMRSAAAHLFPGGPFASKAYHAVYVACFCDDGDVLSQWRGYASGGGYALGFDRDILGSVAIGDLATEPEVSPVQYGASAIPAMVETVLSSVAPFPTGHPGATGFGRAASVVLPALARVKHQAFAEEREWRLITTSQATIGISFRSGPRWPVPYIPCTLPVGALQRVVMGPGPDAGLRERGLNKLLSANGLEDVQVGRSEAPFRG